MSNNLHVAFPSGIGDTLWLMTKMQSLLRVEKKDFLHITICQDSLKRSQQFLQAFDFVSEVDYCDFGIMHQPIANSDGSYNYEPSQRNWHNKFDWFLQMNNHLERGNRLEEWMPALETNWNVMNHFQWQNEHIQFALDFQERIGQYCVFYFGPENGNSHISGHNRGPIWTPNDWKKLQELCTASGLKVVVVGASYDQPYFQRYFLNLDCINCIGMWPIGKTFAVLTQAKFVIGYQSGIVISCPFMDVKAGGFWRQYGDSISPDFFLSFNEKMNQCWVSPEKLDNGDWLPLIYGRDTPESIFKYAKENWL